MGVPEARRSRKIEEKEQGGKALVGRGVGRRETRSGGGRQMWRHL